MPFRYLFSLKNAFPVKSSEVLKKLFKWITSSEKELLLQIKEKVSIKQYTLKYLRVMFYCLFLI